MISIRLQRIGKKGQPSYRLVVANRRSKLGGTPIEDLGSYNIFSKKQTFKAERIKHWINQGAKPTVTVHNLLVKNSILDGKKMAVKMKVKIVAPGATSEPKVEASVPSSA